MNLEFKFEESPVVFKIEELNQKQRVVHERAIHRAQKYLVTEAELLESIIEVDQMKIYEKFGESFLTPYCVKYLGLSDDVAGVFVRVARKSVKVPELKQAIDSGDLCVNKARVIASVITEENQSEWIEKAKTLSKQKLEREIAQESPQKAKPEKARHIGNDRVQITINLSVDEYERRERIRDLVSQISGRLATDSDVEVAFIECYEYYKDPVRKAERAVKKKERTLASKASQESRNTAKKSLSDGLKDNSMDPSRDVFKGNINGPSRDDSCNTPADVIHQVNLRDQGKCQAVNPDGTICGCSRWVHHHHIIPKSLGGPDVLENLITLCSSHHRLWHKRNPC